MDASLPSIYALLSNSSEKEEWIFSHPEEFASIHFDERTVDNTTVFLINASLPVFLTRLLLAVLIKDVFFN